MRFVRLYLLTQALCCCAAVAMAQQGFNFPGGQNQGLNGNQQGFNNFGNNGPGQGQEQGQQNGQGGGANADFQSLIDLIISTVAPDSWAENGGGEAELRPYVGGVYADAKGLLRSTVATRQAGDRIDFTSDRPTRIASTFSRQTSADQQQAADPRKSTTLRCISLTKLEAEIARRKAAGEPFDSTMLALAGLQRVQYVIALPPSGSEPTGEVCVAGPAGNWRLAPRGRIVSTDTGQAILRLDDMLTLLRGRAGVPFGCSINPRPEALAAAQQFLSRSATQPVPPDGRAAWLAELRDAVGEQDIEVFGVDPSSRVAGVLVEADHHMKLVGMGLAEGVPGVESYLTSSVRENRTPAGLLRWWFGMNYQQVRMAADGSVAEIAGQGVKVQSENEMLTERGQRVPTGAADELNQKFAASFTQHFEQLAAKYPVYSELRAVFDLALAAALIRSAGMSDRANWQPSLLVDPEQLPLPSYEPARSVQTVVNHKVVNRRRFVAGVSGGVWAAPRRLLQQREQLTVSEIPNVTGRAEQTTPQQWWWDIEE